MVKWDIDIAVKKGFQLSRSEKPLKYKESFKNKNLEFSRFFLNQPPTNPKVLELSILTLLMRGFK